MGTPPTPATTPAYTPPRDDAMRLEGRWLVIARAAWIATAVVTLVMEIAATPIALQLLQTECVPGQCAQAVNQLTQAQADALRHINISLASYALFVTVWQWVGTLIYAAMGAVIFWRRSDDRMALFAAFMLITFGGAAGNGFTGVLPGSNPAWTVPADVIGIAAQIAFYGFFCLFPSGHFVPRWLRWPALLYALLWLLTLLPVAPLNSLVTGATPPFLVSFGMIVCAQVYRYRRASSPRERQQTKWVVFGFTAGLGVFLAILVFGNVVVGREARESGQSVLFANAILPMLLWLVPISIGIAILRSRLWDIDVIIRRTLVYGSLTALLATMYFSGVVAMQHAAAALAGPQAGANPLIVVVSTLVIAALFSPLRRRVQGVVDQRFYRRTYDAAKTLAAFGAVLRGEVDLDALSDRLVGVTEETMRPAHVSLWLAPERAKREGAI